MAAMTELEKWECAAGLLEVYGDHVVAFLLKQIRSVSPDHREEMKAWFDLADCVKELQALGEPRKRH